MSKKLGLKAIYEQLVNAGTPRDEALVAIQRIQSRPCEECDQPSAYLEHGRLVLSRWCGTHKIEREARKAAEQKARAKPAAEPVAKPYRNLKYHAQLGNQWSTALYEYGFRGNGRPTPRDGAKALKALRDIQQVLDAVGFDSVPGGIQSIRAIAAISG